MSVFFTSDSHLGHANIIKYCNRPFSSADEMDEALIRNWNSAVKPEDHVYHLGDFSLGPKKASEYARRLNGVIHLIVGNHEKRALAEPNLFSSISNLEEITVGGRTMVLCHYAMRTWNKMHRGAYQLYGHSHGSLPESGGLSFDVGVDCWNFIPITIQQIEEKMATKRMVIEDHHGRSDRFDAIRP